MIVLRKSWLRL